MENRSIESNMQNMQASDMRTQTEVHSHAESTPMMMQTNPQTMMPVNWMDTRSFQQALSRMTGHYVMCELSEHPGGVMRHGVLTHVGDGYAVLQMPGQNANMLVDLGALKVVTIYPGNERPRGLPCMSGDIPFYGRTKRDAYVYPVPIPGMAGTGTWNPGMMGDGMSDNMWNTGMSTNG